MTERQIAHSEPTKKLNTKGVFSVREAAMLGFEPWQHEPDEWVPPTNEEWAQLANPYLVTLRLAWSIVYKTKPEMMKVIENLDDDAGESLLGRLANASDFFKAYTLSPQPQRPDSCALVPP